MSTLISSIWPRPSVFSTRAERSEHTLKLGLRILKRTLRLAGLMLALAALYPALALLGALVPVNSGYVAPTAGTPAWVCSNGVHTDLLLPATGGPVDWLEILPRGLFRETPDPGGVLAFGWGDRDFYLTTPDWSDIKLTTALQAIAGGGASVVHIEAVVPPRGNPACRSLLLDQAHWGSLAHYVRTAMANGPNGRPIAIANAGYGPVDGFVVGTGHYSPFFTCNEWVRRGLALAGIRTAWWSPFPFGILWQSG